MEKKQIKPRLEQITPAHIVDCWRLLENALPKYPDCSEESKDAVRSHVFQYLCAPEFFGLMLKVGRRPVGQILAHVVHRPFGAPNRYALIWNAWIDPDYRKRGYMSTLAKEFFGKLKANGVHHWEGEVSEDLCEVFLKKHEAKKVSIRIGGRC